MQMVWTQTRLPMGRKETDKKIQLFREAKENLGKSVAATRTIFRVRKIEIICPKNAAVIIPKGKNKIRGISLISKSVSQSNPLVVEVNAGNLKQDPEKIYKLFIEGDGIISVSVEMEPGQETKKNFLVINSADGVEFLQTKFQVAIEEGALIILN